MRRNSNNVDRNKENVIDSGSCIQKIKNETLNKQ